MTPPESGFQRDLRGHLAHTSSPAALCLSCVSDRGLPSICGNTISQGGLLGDVFNEDDGSHVEDDIDVDDDNNGDDDGGDDGDVMMITVYHSWNAYLSSN